MDTRNGGLRFDSSYIFAIYSPAIPKLIIIELPTKRIVISSVAKPDTESPRYQDQRVSMATIIAKSNVMNPRRVTIRNGALVNDMVAVVAKSIKERIDQLLFPSLRCSTSKRISDCLTNPISQSPVKPATFF